jgi:RsiW-degrading membrane proteinase PrsW (M82 family)
MKLTVTIDSGSLAGNNYVLESGFLTIGRTENCSIRFDPVSERIASKQHAFIEAKPDGFYITDNQSTNGTLLNGERIQTAKLSDGDHIQFGKNGTTATVRIESPLPSVETVQGNVVAQDFRQWQVEQFNKAAEQQPVSVQNSIAHVGLGNLETTKPTPGKTGKYIGIGVTLFAIVFLALIVMLIMVASIGPVAAVIASVVAFTPAIIYVIPLVWLDRYDPEPAWLLGLAFCWGALVAVVVSFVINTLIGTIIALGVSPAAGQVAGAVISAPLFEEGSKGLGVVILLIFFRRYFDDILDGIVFAGVIALGFATVENILYYGQGILAGGSQGLIALFVVRGIMSPFAHVTFTSMTGIGCGISRESHNKLVRLIMPILGYFGAVTLHAIWNGMAVLGGLGGFVVGYFILEVPFFFIFVGFAFYIMHRQNKILKEMLAIDIARGLIPPDHGAIATSAFKSSGWLLGGIFGGKFFARSRYLRALGKLGLSYWHIQRATAAQGQTGSFQQNPILREEVLKWRDQV